MKHCQCGFPQPDPSYTGLNNLQNNAGLDSTTYSRIYLCQSPILTSKAPILTPNSCFRLGHADLEVLQTRCISLKVVGTWFGKEGFGFCLCVSLSLPLSLSHLTQSDFPTTLKPTPPPHRRAQAFMLSIVFFASESRASRSSPSLLLV